MFLLRPGGSCAYLCASLQRAPLGGRTRLPRSLRYNSTFAPTSRRTRVTSYIWYTLCLTIGVGLGYQLRLLARPPSQPLPGSTEDHAALQSLASQIDSLDIVKCLRAEEYHLHSDTHLKDLDKGQTGWRELDIKDIISDDADYGNGITRTLTQQSMAGARGLGVQRAFWNPITRELVAVVWCGASITGWPGLTHGGAIATMFSEALSRVVAGPDRSLDSIPSPASLSLTYARPTQSLNFYILRASFSDPDIPQEAPPPEPQPAESWLPSWKDLTKKIPSGSSTPTVNVSGTLETLGGRVCVRAKASFPASAVI